MNRTPNSVSFSRAASIVPRPSGVGRPMPRQASWMMVTVKPRASGVLG